MRLPFSFIPFWLSAGDILLKLALEDERFYLLALERRALDVFEDTELSMGKCCNFAVTPW
jgi:hypothetical protein